MKICFIDTLGLCYDGSTLTKRGLGGSESAVILMSKELSKLGFDVTVFNDCVSDDACPGYYDRVLYLPLADVEKHKGFDVVIASRSVAAFAPVEMRANFKTFLSMPDFTHIMSDAKYKVLWMHDTFCDGDNLIETFLLDGRINQIFTLSDFHTDYVTNCDHGRKRMFEVMKRFIFQTRNGITRYHDWVDVSKKDPNLFVYNSSVTKGMMPLVESIWPRILQAIPNAKLTVIGGYYRMRSDHAPDAQEQMWRDMVARHPEVEFTGVIKQSEIADILAEASYMIYPCDFPETFGISTLESLAYNTPLITCNFGAMEETAIDLASYKIPYPIKPNGLFPWIPGEEQINRFVDMTVRAYTDKYLHQQKMYACNQVKDVCGWNTVALQWKQHFYKKLDMFMSIDEHRRVTDINHRVRKVFGRRFANLEELQEPQQQQQRIVIVTPVYNSEQYIAKCIESVAAQDYDNYVMYIVNDASTDNTYHIACDFIDLLPEELHDKFWVSNNDINRGAVYNQIQTIRTNCNPNDIVILLDGDDWLVNDPNIFHKYNNLYRNGAEFTYGSCWSVVDNIPLIAQPYPPEVKANRGYREHKFNWNMPYTHLRTFKGSLMHDYINEHGYWAFKCPATFDWLKAGGDTAVFYSLIEQADPDRVVCVPDVVYNYNDANPLNDYKVNRSEQTQTANFVINQTVVEKKDTVIKNGPKKKILIAIPTARYIEPDTFKSIYDLEVPEGYETTFQSFFGYKVDQVRNLIANWTINGFDYLFSVDHDVTFAPDTLKKLLSHDRDVVSGMYRQRREPQTLEVYDMNLRNIPYEQLHNRGLVQIGACGFGCILVKKAVFVAVGYPQFVYHDAIDHKDTFSEDLDFLTKARNKGFTVWADTSILCGHIGSHVFRIEMPQLSQTPSVSPAEQKLLEIANEVHLPKEHRDYLSRMNIKPDVVYDIGANVLEWTKKAKEIWPRSTVIAFEAMDEAFQMYKESGFDYHIGVLSDSNDKEVTFYQTPFLPWGSSYYKENDELSGEFKYNESHSVIKKTKTLDTVVKEHNFPLPDLVKIDVQGAELDILKGGEYTLKCCRDLIIELQHKEYNVGAPLKEEVIEYLESIGFELVSPIHLKEVDGDYHFRKRATPKRVYILQTSNELSQKYSKTAAESCKKLGIPYFLVNGVENKTVNELQHLTAISNNMDDRAACATVTHFLIWKHIAETNECAIILEHDAIMLHNIDIDIPDNKIVALGYKFKNYDDYDWEAAGPPTEIINCQRHSGAHAYCITPKTARLLLDELKEVGAQRAIDNFYFMRINQPGDTASRIPLAIASPTPAICWLRESTIWNEPSTLNYDIIDSFKNNFRGAGD